MSLAMLKAALEKSSIREILIYRGKGVFSDSFQGTRQLFLKLDMSWDVKEVTVQDGNLEPRPETWEPKKSLFVMPGGHCSTWDEQIGSEVHKIRNFVERGGYFLGICAGGYYASQVSMFRCSKSMVLQRERKLSLFSGTAAGPIFYHPKAYDCYGVSWEPKVVNLKWEGEDIDVPILVLGGPEFIPKSPERAKVCARLHYGTKTACAVVKTTNALGVSILLNCHPDTDAKRLDEVTLRRHFPMFEWKHIKEALQGTEEARLALFARILTEFTM